MNPHTYYTRLANWDYSALLKYNGSAWVNYDFSEFNESKSRFKWFRNDVEIEGANSSTYSLTSADANKIIKFGVIPTSIAGSGKIVKSQGVKIWNDYTNTNYKIYDDLTTNPIPASYNPLSLDNNSNFNNVKSKSFTINPNPASKKIYIDLNKFIFKSLKIQILNTAGNIVLELTDINLDNYNYIKEIDVSQLQNGVFFVILSSESDFIYSKFSIIR